MDQDPLQSRMFRNAALRLSQSRSYQYAALREDRQEIRLLGLDLGNNEHDLTNGVVAPYTLMHVSLQDHPSYTAISYVWGDSTPTHSIYLDGKFLYIRESLAAALHYIRLHIVTGSLGDEAPQLFWIDALCVDQQNKREKGQQVELMRQIYASAHNVLSCLGTGFECDDGSIRTAFSFIKGIVETASTGNKSTMATKHLQSAAFVEGESSREIEAAEVIVDPRLMHLFSLSESVIDFFSLEYWHRIWIVQEVVLTQPEGNLLMYGNEIISFQDVQVFRDNWLPFLKELQLNPDWEPILSKTDGWDGILDSWTNYLQRMEESLVVWSYYDFMRGLNSSGDSLFYIILATAYKKSDPRDAVFGLLGLVSSPRLIPEYQKSVIDIYTEWFTSVLHDWQDLQPLYFCGFNQRTMDGLPSWVPDLSTRRNDSPVWDATLARTVEGNFDSTNYSFGQQKSAQFLLISNDKRILHTRGVLCDRVTIVYRIQFEHACEQMALFCITCLRDEHRKLYRTGIPILQAIFRALMCGINRFSPDEGQGDTSLISRDMQMVLGTHQLQLTHTMPLLQAVAKFLIQRGDLSAEDPGDIVIKALCRIPPPLGTTSASEVHLAAAFLVFLISGKPEQSISRFLQSLNLPAGSSFSQTFIDTFFSDRVEGVKNFVSEDLLNDQNVLALVDSIHRYFRTYQHTFFFTSSGYLGNGPPSMQNGDMVVAFEGVKMPFVVREKLGEFLLVGPCYVEGLSNGEPAAMARRGELKVEDISLI